MHGTSRMRLPMSAKLPAIWSIPSANGLGMKCVHASMRIMGAFLRRLVLRPRRQAGRAVATGASRARQRARGMAAPRLSSRSGLVDRGRRTRRRGIEAIAHANKLRGERLELLGVVRAACAHQTLMHHLLLAPHLQTGG